MTMTRLGWDGTLIFALYAEFGTGLLNTILFTGLTFLKLLKIEMIYNE